MEPEKVIRKQRLSGLAKAKALMRAKGFKSKDPFFVVLMQPSFVGAGFRMIVPFPFAKTYLSKSQDVILKVQNGRRTWSVDYICRQYKGSSSTRFDCGWKAFVRDNDLKVGDVCAFVLKKSIGIILFEVVIFHGDGVANSPVLTGKQELYYPILIIVIIILS
ncbi:B3 domain-containing protein REM19-like [Cannabis sativa]|uniref:B3 domain-containing protein REM19-like n=1 Tax=Cannabis sativa TaxID=3483 RepID=UPI0029CA8B8D|nr:B3 domain-containing protein REM19-like [Cannabis sativa]